MTAPIGSALTSYAQALARAQSQATAQTGQQPAAQTDFASLLAREVEDSVGALRQGEAMSRAAVLGQASVQEVVQAVTEAELSLQKVTAVRDRVISAYQEIMRMPV